MHGPALAAILAAALGWGLAGVGVRFAFDEGAATLAVVVVRTLVAASAVFLYAAVARPALGKAAWWQGGLIGIPRIGLAPLCFIASLNHVSAGFQGLVITLTPVFTAAMGRLFLGERLSRVQVAGLVLGMTGSSLLILSGETGLGDGSGSTLVGGLLALGGVFFASTSMIFARRFAPRHGTASLAVPMFLAGALVVVPVAAVQGFEFASLTPTAWWVVVVIGFTGTLLPFVATLYAARFVDAAIVAVTGYLAPVLAVAGGVVLLDEVLAPSIVLGGLLALAGSVLVSRGRRPPPAAAVGP